MNRTKVLLVSAGAVLAALCVAGPSSAQVSQSPSGAWGGVYNHPSETARQVGINAAIAAEMAREGGYGSGTTNSTTYIEDYNSEEYHYGPETNSGATNSVNSNSTSIRTDVGAGGSNVTVNASAGTSQQTQGGVTQGATAQTNVNNRATDATASTAN